MALSSSSKENISLKKLVGKAHTSNALEAFNESKTTGLTLSTTSIFAENISTTPDSTDLYDITDNTVEYVRLVATALPESLVDGKYHAFKLSLPADYEANSSNAKAGTLSFLDSQDLNASIGKLQLVPPQFADAYEAKVYYDGNDTKSNGTRIPLLDERSWYLDYFNGILFQETPPDNANENPSHVEAYIYIGNMANTAISSSDISASSIGDLSDVDITTNAPNENQVLKWDGTKFVPANDISGGGDSFSASTSTLWALDSNGNLFPHGIIDGTLDTGMFAIELSAGNMDFTSNNTTLDDIVNAIQNMNAYTLSNRAQADISDTYWEIDENGNVTPKDAG
tara:strand:- start:7129 stop:8148 length:1020 start_codon:yes stop_codon:yes gene_type:complete